MVLSTELALEVVWTEIFKYKIENVHPQIEKAVPPWDKK